MNAWIVDLDGVMWRGGDPIPGSADAVGSLLGRGDTVVFCTNNSTLPGRSRAAELASQGVPEGGSVVTSADAACSLVTAGEDVLVLGSEGLLEVLRGTGASPVAARDLADRFDVEGTWGDPAALCAVVGEYDAVLVGLAREVDYRQLDLVCSAVQQGARLLATNTDVTFPASGRLQPGTGSIVAAVEAATGVRATVAGKPHAPMARSIEAVIGHGYAPPPVVVGDSVDTDGRLAQQLGCPFVLVLSGATPEVPSEPPVEVHAVARDLAAVVAGNLVSGSLPPGAGPLPDAPGHR